MKGRVRGNQLAALPLQPTTSNDGALLTFAHVLISKSVALIAMIFPNEKKGMRVKPLLVSKEVAQRSGGLPTLIPLR
jgi:hypothetical protein